MCDREREWGEEAGFGSPALLLAGYLACSHSSSFSASLRRVSPARESPGELLHLWQDRC